MLTEYLSWRWCLYVNVPVSIIAAFGILTFLSKDEPDREARLDLPGTCRRDRRRWWPSSTASRAPRPHGWSDTVTLVMFALGAIGLTAFVLIERRVSSPLLPLNVVLDRARGGSYVTFAFAGIGMFGVFLFLTYYLEGSLGYSPVKTGFGFLPFIAGILVASNGLAARLQARFGKRGVMTGGMALSALGLVLLTRIDLHSSYCVLRAAEHADDRFRHRRRLPARPRLRDRRGERRRCGRRRRDDQCHPAGRRRDRHRDAQHDRHSRRPRTYVSAHPGETDAVARGNVHSYIVAFWWAAAIFAVGAVVTRLLLPKDAAPPAEGATVVHH